MQVGLIMFYHESNTLVDQPITIDSFRDDTLCVGPDVRDQFAGSHHELGGFFKGLDQEGIEAVPLFAARIIPGGVVTADTYDALLGDLPNQLTDVGSLDGLLTAPHGASVSDHHHDMNGHWLSQVRNQLEPRLPIVSTLDAHAILSQSMVESTDAIIAYRTNPHLDQFERGAEASRLMGRILNSQVRSTQRACFPPVQINIERQGTSDPPLKDLCAQVDAVRHESGVLSASLLLGFQWADVPDAGSSFVVVTNNDPDLAQNHANALGDWLWQHREQFEAELIGIDQAIEKVAARSGRVLLLDMGDNIGGASPSDGTLIAHALRTRAAEVGPIFVCLADAEAVRLDSVAGMFARFDLANCGKTDDRHGPPLRGRVKVVSLHDGRFKEDLKLHSGFTEYDMGPSAVIRTDDGMTILMNTRPTMPFSLKQLTSCDIDPRAFGVIVAKGVHAPIATYAPVCNRIVRVNTAGMTTIDMNSLHLQHRRRPLFPFERDFE